MKIRKNQISGRVEILTDNINIDASIPPNYPIFKSPKGDSEIWITPKLFPNQSDPHFVISVEDVTGTIISGVETSFSGDVNDLINKLSTDFFFEVTRFDFPEVETFADLPPANQNTGQTYQVVTGTFQWSNLSRKQSGLYRSNGTNWILRNDLSSLLVDSEFNIRDEANNSNGVFFNINQLSALREITFPDRPLSLIGELDIWEASIYSDQGLITQNTLQPNAVNGASDQGEPFFIRETIPNVSNDGTWTVLFPFNGQIEYGLSQRVSYNNTNNNYLSHIRRDGAIIDFPYHYEPKDSAGEGVTLPSVNNGVIGGNLNSGTDQFIVTTMTKTLNVTQGQSMALKFEFANQNANNEATTYECRIWVRRIINKNQ